MPNIDDGAKSLEISLKMLKYAAEQGITDVVNTVHYQHPKVETEDISFERIKKEVNILQSELDNNDIPITLHCGAEVFFLPNLIKIKDDPLATFLHGRYMLIEFQIHHIPPTHKQLLFDLKMANVTPIIAHPERYLQVQENINIVAEWLDTGCLIQVDAGSPLGYLGSRSQVAAERIIKNGWCQVLGSDSHDDKKRNFCLAESVDYVRNWIGDYVDTMVEENPRLILNGDKLIVDVKYDNYEKHNYFSLIKSRLGLN